MDGKYKIFKIKIQEEEIAAWKNTAELYEHRYEVMRRVAMTCSVIAVAVSTVMLLIITALIMLSISR